MKKPGRAVDASRVSLSRLVLNAAANEVTPARVANLGCRQLIQPAIGSAVPGVDLGQRGVGFGRRPHFALGCYFLISQVVLCGMSIEV
jgi:hypothetical protein